MIIHEHGPKGERDRRQALAKYHQVCGYFHIREVRQKELAQLSNLQIYRLGEEAYERQSIKRKVKFLDHFDIVRKYPLAYKWFVRDMVKLYRAVGWRWWAVVLTAPFRYPGFLKRSKRAAEQKATTDVKAEV